MTGSDICRMAVEAYGADAQMTVALEELSELQKEICKAKRGKLNVENISEEIADVEIMLEQLRIMFENAAKVNEWRERKLLRLKVRMIEEGVV